MGSNGGRAGRVGGMPAYAAPTGPAALRLASHPPATSTSTSTFLAAAGLGRSALTESAPSIGDSTTAAVAAAVSGSATVKPSATQTTPLNISRLVGFSPPPPLLERRLIRQQSVTSLLSSAQPSKGRHLGDLPEADAAIVDVECERVPKAWPPHRTNLPPRGGSTDRPSSAASTSDCRRSPDCPWAFDGQSAHGHDSGLGFACGGSPAKTRATAWLWQQPQEQPMRPQQQHVADPWDDDVQPSVSPSDRLSSEIDRRLKTFNMRMVTLANLPQSAVTCSRVRSAAVQRARAGVTTNAARSLTLLRQTVQQKITREVRDVLQGWVRRLFRPAVEALRAQRGDNAAGEEHLNAVCRDILDEVKRSYLPAGSGGGGGSSCSGTGVAGGTRSCGSTPRGSPAPSAVAGSWSSRSGSDLPRSKLTGSQQQQQQAHPSRPSLTVDGTGAFVLTPPRKRGRPRKVHPAVPPPHATSQMKPEACGTEAVSLPPRLPTYDPARVNSGTLFITGSRANSALGLGATRGKVYQRHPELFKYAVDSDDRHWLQEQRIIRPAGGATYLMLLDEIRTLVGSSLYRENPSLVPSELYGFEIPDWMLSKVQSHMTYLRRAWPSDALAAQASADGLRTHGEPGSTRRTNISAAAVAGSALVCAMPAPGELVAVDAVAQSECENEVTMPLTVSMLPLIEIEPGDVDLDGVEDDDTIDDGPPDLSLPSD